MQHHTTLPCPSISALTVQLPIIAKSSGQRGWPSVRTGGAGRPGPWGGSLFCGIIIEIIAAGQSATLHEPRDCQQESNVVTIPTE
jgi:hypothetical protein